jgi:hypothetical protein
MSTNIHAEPKNEVERNLVTLGQSVTTNTEGNNVGCSALQNGHFGRLFA